MSLAKKESSALTRFERDVLSVTTKIPIGQTRTYKWVAEKIGKPLAVRAVGNALKRNPYPVIIPCHRVIKSDGALGGYVGRYGRKKAQLLKKERVIANLIVKK